MFPSPSKAPRLGEPALRSGARGPSRLRAVAAWALAVLAVGVALWPVRVPAATSSPITVARSSLLFAGEDVAALQEIAVRVAFDRPGTLRVAPVDLAVSPEGARVERPWGTTDASLDAGLYVTPKAFPFDPADERRSFPFTVTVDPAALDRARYAGLRFTFEPTDGAVAATSVTVPVYALPPVGFDATGDAVSIGSVGLSQARSWTLVDRVLPDLPLVVGHAPGRARASITATGELPTLVEVAYAFRRLNPLSWLPFVEDGSRAFRTGVERVFLLPGERASDAAASRVATSDGARFDALPFAGFVRVTATARAVVDGAAGSPATASHTVLVFPWSESLLLVGLVLVARRRRSAATRRAKDRYAREGLSVITTFPDPVERIPSRAAAAVAVPEFGTTTVRGPAPEGPVGRLRGRGGVPALGRLLAALSGALRAVGGVLGGGLGALGRGIGTAGSAVGRRLPAVGAAFAAIGRGVGSFLGARARSLGEFLVWMPQRIRFLAVGIARLVARAATAIAMAVRATASGAVSVVRRATGATARTVGTGATVTARATGSAARTVVGGIRSSATVAARGTGSVWNRLAPVVFREIETVVRGLAIAVVLSVRAITRTVAATPRVVARAIVFASTFVVRETPVAVSGFGVILGFVGRGLRAVVIAVWWVVTIASNAFARVFRVAGGGSAKVLRAGAGGSAKVLRAGADGSARVLRTGAEGAASTAERVAGGLRGAASWLWPRVVLVATSIVAVLRAGAIGVAFVVSVGSASLVRLAVRGAIVAGVSLRRGARSVLRVAVLVLRAAPRTARIAVTGIVWVGALGGIVLGWALRDAGAWAAPRIRVGSRSASRVLVAVLAAVAAALLVVLRVLVGAAARATGALLRAVERAAARIADVDKDDAER